MNRQAKIDFEKWVFDNYRQYSGNYHSGKLSIFTDLTSQMTNALIIEWFDSVGIYILMQKTNKNSIWFEIKNYNFEDVKINVSQHIYKNRNEATDQAINKAVEIYNNLK